MSITLIGLDADDTLWHNETIFRMTQARFADLLKDHGDPAVIEEHLVTVERRNLAIYGYGAKGFTLSMMETALELSEGRVPSKVLAEILAAGREMMAHPIEPLPGVEEALAVLADQARLILITKGDLFHQEQKLAASGLGRHFHGVEIVSEKTPECYTHAFRRHGGDVAQAVMAGNSVKSDVIPALTAGAWAALVPYPLVWRHEAADAPADHPRYRELETLADLPGWVAEIRAAA
ncbi:HAD family hydrolase [Sphingomonas naphthae]|uniref:HAD family hydrolase n=1 Tax=Sphingomonas naphthae TaxID=1813468 RepID=A0ABY7TMG9_9SPHN|nr:HAD family hydrolase [Sphingomonas naphthae]WCT74233.1 HAD family hydrolase [Sphingomonas naphthae]